MAKERFPALLLFLSFIRLHRGIYSVVLSLFFISGVSINLVPYMTGILTSAATARPINLNWLWAASVLFTACNLVHWLFWHLAEYIYAKYILRDLFQFDSWLFRQVISRDYDYYINKFSGKISSYLASLGREFRELVPLVFYAYLQQLIFIPVLIATLWTVNGITAIIFTLNIALMVFVSSKTLPPVLQEEARFTNKAGDVNGSIFDAFSNYVNVKAFKAELHEERRLRNSLHALADTAQNAYWRDLAFWITLSTIVRVLVWPITTSYNVYLYSSGAIGIAEFSTFLASLVLYATLIWETIAKFSDLSRRVARIDESYRYLLDGIKLARAPSYRESIPEVEPAIPFELSLELRDIDFAYPDAPELPVFKNLSFSVKKGEKVGIVGRSGSGKTTLIKLLLGYYNISCGTLLVDEKPIERGQLVKLLTYVPQDTTLFNRSLRENIAYNLDPEQCTQELLELAADRSLALEFIDKLPERFDTLVGERGIKLSAGQRQRVAIARAIIRDRPIIILDEATSALDSESESQIKEAFENLWKGKTVIAIAHRLSTLMNMDRIVVFSRGEIVESGSHDELIAQRGIYERLWRHQSGIMIGEE